MIHVYTHVANSAVSNLLLQTACVLIRPELRWHFSSCWFSVGWFLSCSKQMQFQVGPWFAISVNWLCFDDPDQCLFRRTGLIGVFTYQGLDVHFPTTFLLVLGWEYILSPETFPMHWALRRGLFRYAERTRYRSSWRDFFAHFLRCWQRIRLSVFLDVVRWSLTRELPDTPTLLNYIHVTK